VRLERIEAQIASYKAYRDRLVRLSLYYRVSWPGHRGPAVRPAWGCLTGPAPLYTVVTVPWPAEFPDDLSTACEGGILDCFARLFR
jgi:hypothetical protein